MANIDRIEELVCKHSVDAMGLGDENGHYNGKYKIDGDHLLEILEQAERVEGTVRRNKELEYASKYNGELNEFLQKRKLPPNTLGRHVVDVVMDYVEELEKDIGNYKKACSALETLESYSRKESQRYRQALEFYANRNNYSKGILRPAVLIDYGRQAEKALAGEPNESLD